MAMALSPIPLVDPGISQKIRQLLSELLVAIGVGRLPEELNVNGRKPDGSRPPDRPLTVNQLCRAYVQFAEDYYRHSDGAVTSEVDTIKYAQRLLKELFGNEAAVKIGPLCLKRVREKMIEKRWCRRHINQQIGRIKRMYKWAVSNELVSSSVYQALASVDGLRIGRSAARESIPVKPAPEEQVHAVLPHVSEPVVAMIHLQMLTGMRPGEVTIMRGCDIDRSEEVWRFVPMHHKTEHHACKRFVYLGPKCQEILQPFLNRKQPSEYLFSPKDADKARRERFHLLRKTPLSCGNVPGSNRKRRPKRKPGDHYDTNAYAKAVTYGCRLAFPLPDGLAKEEQRQWRREHHWHPHQLRHNAATRLRREYGLDVAQVILGHKTLAITQVYAEKDAEAAKRVMSTVG